MLDSVAPPPKVWRDEPCPTNWYAFDESARGVAGIRGRSASVEHPDSCACGGTGRIVEPG